MAVQLSVQTVANSAGGRAYKVALLLKEHVIGQATLFDSDAHVSLDWMYLYPDKRGQGFGEEAMRELHAYFPVQIEPVSVLDSAKPFWQRMGQKGYCFFNA